MKRFERELSIFFITSVPCFVLASVFFIFVKEEVIFSIIAFAFGMFLVCVCFWLSQESMTNAGNICGEESQDERPDEEPLDRCIEELQERVRLLEDKIAIHESNIKQLIKNPGQSEVISRPKRVMANVPPLNDPGPKKEDFSFTCNIKGIEDKKELALGEHFFVVRNGRGVMTLKNFSLLVPNAFETGKEVTSDMHDLWTSYNMGKLFELNSRDMIHFKIIRVTPAKIQITEDKGGDTLQGVLQKKGKIELG